MSLTFTIGQLSETAQTPAATIRYYEKIGLLESPSRSVGNYRLYGSGDVARLTFVRRAREIGFTIDQVRSLLAFSDRSDGDCCAVTTLTERHLVEVEQKIRDLNLLKEHLARLLASCKGGRFADCRIIDALTPPQQVS